MAGNHGCRLPHRFVSPLHQRRGQRLGHARLVVRDRRGQPMRIPSRSAPVPAQFQRPRQGKPCCRSRAARCGPGSRSCRRGQRRVQHAGQRQAARDPRCLRGLPGRKRVPWAGASEETKRCTPEPLCEACRLRQAWALAWLAISARRSASIVASDSRVVTTANAARHQQRAQPHAERQRVGLLRCRCSVVRRRRRRRGPRPAPPRSAAPAAGRAPAPAKVVAGG